ncbi:MAG: PH domain-containing protein [Chitinophagaceae bacterium]|nr:PH domain-containing protein [Chitinophagaceae bacterium]
MNRFDNDPVDLALLPKAETISLQPIELSYKKVLLWSSLIGWGVMGVIAGIIIYFTPALHSIIWVPVIAAGIICLFLLQIWITFKSVARSAYAIRERDLVYQSGWIMQRFSVCPFNRIQHCSVNAGPFERKLNLASLSVYTAGTEGADIKIPGLAKERAFELRDFIMKKSGYDDQHGD